MNISILGCGWLGLPLGAELVRRGHSVRGSVTQLEKLRELENIGISPHRLELIPTPTGDLGSFFDTDALVITLPPKRSEPGVLGRYPAQLAAVLEKTPAATQLIFTSSTSVYPELSRAVREADAGGDISESGKAILEAEALVRERSATILRLAGLYGYDRQPGRRLSGRSITGGNVPVNLVHRDDVLRVMLLVIEKGMCNLTLNVCTDLHPRRREVYSQQAKRHGFAPPNFTEPHNKPFKRVSSEKLKRLLGFSFRYPDPIEPSP